MLPDTILLDDSPLPITVEADDDDFLEVVSDVLGPKGDPGADGRDGVDGLPGRDGVDGADGTDGLPGTPGLPGADGQDGTNGQDGADGRDGIDGLPGAPGADGRDGIDGLPGRDGADGTDGLPGTPGLPGTNGRDGTDGRDGVDGQDGTDGAPGLKGDPGSPGLPFALVATGSVNLITAEGRYAVSSAQGTTANGYPSGGAGTLEVAIDAAGSTYQTHQITSSPGVTLVFRRQRTPAGTWFSWREWQASRFDAAAGRAQYTWDRSNLREQLTYYDSGWRDISALLAAGYVGQLKIRRLGYVVYLAGNVACAAGLTTVNGTFLAATPPGFEGVGSPWPDYPVHVIGSSTWFALQRKGAAELIFTGAPAVTDASRVRFEVSWSTVSAVTNALPGLADGIIPNQ